MLLRCGFDDGEGRYTSRFLRTDAYEDARSSGTAGEFATRTNGLVGTPRAC
jgi:carotenoid cleavage dioxygenase-like enzyme